MTDEFFKILPQRLQNACATSFERYQRFLENDPGQDPKRVTAHHHAGKTVIGHMTALIKLLQIFDKAPPRKSAETDLDSLTLQARHALSQDDDAKNQL